MEKKVLGRKVPVEIGGKSVIAKVDTGAYRSSIDRKLVNKGGLFEFLGIKKVRTVNGSTDRKVVKSKIRLFGKKYRITFTLANREDMKYDIILGRRFLRNKFLVDVSK